MPHRIEDYAIIGDCETAALVSRDGSVDWLCWPRFDSGACFAALLGDRSHGCWRIAPCDAEARASRRYRGNTLILETTFETAKTVSGDLSLKTISALRANAEVGFAHLEALVAAKTLSEVIELQTSFLRKRVEMSVEQAKDFQAVASKADEKVSAPLKTVFEKAVKELKVA